MVTRKVWLLAVNLLVLAADPHTQSVQEWRKKYEEGLKAPYTGWLSVAGLYWLKEGENLAGSADNNDVVLPRGPAKAGTFLFDGKTVRYRDPKGAIRSLRTDTSGTPAYNKGLSVRRAQAVAAELVKNGVARNSIAIQGFGDTKLLVPTGPNTREPQNRRVEIIIR